MELPLHWAEESRWSDAVEQRPSLVHQSLGLFLTLLLRQALGKATRRGEQLFPHEVGRRICPRDANLLQGVQLGLEYCSRFVSLLGDKRPVYQSAISGKQNLTDTIGMELTLNIFE